MAKPMKLSSVLKNVPVDLMWELRKYHSPNPRQELRWRARQPVEGKMFGWGGNLKWEDAKSADLYAYDREYKARYWELYERHSDLKEQKESLENYCAGLLTKEREESKYKNWEPVIEGIERLMDIINFKRGV